MDQTFKRRYILWGKEKNEEKDQSFTDVQEDKNDF